MPFFDGVRKISAILTGIILIQTKIAFFDGVTKIPVILTGIILIQTKIAFFDGITKYTSKNTNKKLVFKKR